MECFSTMREKSQKSLIIMLKDLKGKLVKDKQEME
jgi:hypothetical protein